MEVDVHARDISEMSIFGASEAERLLRRAASSWSTRSATTPSRTRRACRDGVEEGTDAAGGGVARLRSLSWSYL
jgi:hypothetical protein